MSDMKVKFLLKNEYINIKNTKDILSLNSFDLDIATIVGWLEEKRKRSKNSNA